MGVWFGSDRKNPAFEALAGSRGRSGTDLIPAELSG
jgi:hypothetical protein